MASPSAKVAKLSFVLVKAKIQLALGRSRVLSELVSRL